MKMNYTNLKKWIYGNPRVVNINRLCVECDIKPQHFHYYFENNKPMPKYMVDKSVKTYSINDDQSDGLFYLTKSYK